MIWKNQLQLENENTNPEFRKKFVRAFTLNFFLKRCLVSDGYKPPDMLGNSISLSPSGNKWKELVQNAVKDITPPEINVALFLKFFHEELFVDVGTTDTEKILDVLHTEIIGDRIKYPWVYDRVLYDRFYDMFPNCTKGLSHIDTMRLLEDTPKGVFQLMDVVVGPFGVLNSECDRFVPPVTNAPMWHCSDPSCYALHPVRLSSGKTKIREAIDFISDEFKKINGSPSEWDGLFYALTVVKKYYDDKYLWKLPFLLANAFSEGEMREILSRLIHKHSEKIRNRFPKEKCFKDILSGSAEQISERLTKSECLQLILSVSEDIIVNCIESLIDEKIINIPSTETRNPRLTYITGGWLDLTCECSQFGVRSISESYEIALPRLRWLIRELYKEKQELEQLGHKLRYIPGESIYQKLDRYIHDKDPKQIIGDLVYASSDHLKRAFEILRYGNFIHPSSLKEELRLFDKIL